jgi:glycosyltransferase involved in cell wall biosynthesis
MESNLEPEVTIVVPVQTREGRIEDVVASISGELERLGKTWEAILVFDGLKGDLWERGLKMQAETHDRVRTIALHRAFGEAVCLSSAFEHARGGIILTSPEYVQIEPRDIDGLFRSLDNGSDVATGMRTGRVDSWLNQFQSRAFNSVLRMMTGARFHDLNCSLRLIRRDVLEQLTLYGNMYRYLPLIAYKQGFRVEEVHVRHLAEQGGNGVFGAATYVRRFLDILAVVFLTRFTHKPLRFFGALGGACMGVGTALALALVVRNLFVSEAVVFSHPLFLLGVLLLVLGVQIVGFGLVGEIVIFTQARNVREYRIETFHEAE